MENMQDRPVVGFVGLGDQGLPIARAIVDGGYTVHSWARNPEVLDDPRSSPLVRLATAVELAASVDVVALCVSTDEVVLELAQSMMPAMREGALFVNHGTGTPANAVELAKLGAQTGVGVVDAPVSGGRQAAEAHTLTTLVGGGEGAVRTLRPVFDTFSSHVFHLGPAGQGQLAKVLNNALMMTNMRAIADILDLVQGTDTDIPRLIDALRSGSAASRALDLLGTMITTETADHLAEVLTLDLDIFATAMRGRGADPETTDRVVAGGAAGARRLADMVALVR